VRPRADEDAIAAGAEILRYPPGLRGLPALPLEHLLAEQADMIHSLGEALRLPLGQFEAYIVPVVEAYARYVHLLPASESHHHRACGGLFRHGLEVAYHAARASIGTVFTMESERYRREPVWRAGVCLAGLLHDIGKPAADVTVSDREDAWRWQPGRQPLADALAAAGIRHYYLTWTPDRHRRHEMHGPLMLHHCMPAATADWLSQADPRIYDHVLAAAGGADKEGVVGRLVMRGEAISVREDLRAAGYDPDAYALGVPVDRYLVDAMRELVRRGNWTCNVPGARLWHFSDGLYVVWQTGDDISAARDIRELIDEQGIPGVPRTPEKIAPELIARGHIQTYEEHGERHFLRPITAGCFATDGRPVTLYLAKLSSPSLLFPNEPPPPLPDQSKAGRRDGSPASRSGQAGAAKLQPTVPAGPGHNSPSSADPGPSRPTATQTTPAEGNPAQTQPAGSARPEQTGAPSASAAQTRPQPQPQPGRDSIGAGPARTGPSAVRPAQGQSDQKPASPAKPEPQSQPDSNEAKGKAKADVLAWLGQRGRAGAVLRALIERQSTADLAPEARAFEHDGHVCWRWEMGLTGLSDTPPIDALRALHDAGLTVIDGRRPAVRTREVAGQRVVMLTRPVSERVLVLTGPLRELSTMAGGSGDPGRSPMAAGPAHPSQPGSSSASSQDSGSAPAAKPTTKPSDSASPAVTASQAPEPPAASSLVGNPDPPPAEPATSSALSPTAPDPSAQTPDALYAALRRALADGMIEIEYAGDIETAERLAIPPAVVEQLAAQAGLTAMSYRRRLTLHAAILPEGKGLVLCPRLARANGGGES
jgi:conjugal transfer pilus assembly protein TraI